MKFKTLKWISQLGACLRWFEAVFFFFFGILLLLFRSPLTQILKGITSVLRYKCQAEAYSKNRRIWM